MFDKFRFPFRTQLAVEFGHLTDFSAAKMVRHVLSACIFVISTAMPLMKSSVSGRKTESFSLDVSRSGQTPFELISHQEEDIPLEDEGGGESTGFMVKCNNKTMEAPRGGYLLQRNGKSIFVCATAKAASSTIAIFIQSLVEGKHHSSPSDARKWIDRYELSTINRQGRIQELCDVDFSLAVIRNPFDRVRSAFEDKVNRVTHVPGKHQATFADFLDALKQVPVSSMNGHWKPISIHCKTGDSGYPYTKLYRVEDSLEASMLDAFKTLGYSEQAIKQFLTGSGEVNANTEDSHDLQARLEFYREQRSDARKIVHDLYYDDMKIGNYSFGVYP